MLIVNKTYRIVDDENDTVINIEKDNNSRYHWKVINADGDELGFVLTDLNMSDIFKAIKDMTNNDKSLKPIPNKAAKTKDSIYETVIYDEVN